MADADRATCSQCGAPLSPDDPRGVCPSCLVSEPLVKLGPAIRLNPDDAHAHAALGEALRRQGKLDDAVAERCAAIQLEPDNAGAPFYLARTLYQQAKLEKAVAEFRTAIRLNPVHGEARYNIGLALSEQGRLNEAIAEFRKATKTLSPAQSSPSLSSVR